MSTEDIAIRELKVNDLTQDAFSSFGTVIPPMEDGTPFGPQDAQLELGNGTPRFYNMRIPGRGLTIRQITRHLACTQSLASAGGYEWFVAVAPPRDLEDLSAEPDLSDIRAFRIPGDVAIMLYAGTWHAGPLFEDGERCFFNLELADTNVVDHHTCHFAKKYGIALKLV